MSNWSLKAGFTILAMAISQLAYAGNSVLAGEFDGSELKTDVVWSQYSYFPPLATQEIKFTVTASGTYRMEDAFEYWHFHKEGRPGLWMINALYTGDFDPLNPAANRIGTNQYAAWPRQLQAGVEYTLVLQNPSSSPAGVWTMAFNGPGEVTSSARATLPTLGQGKFTGAELKSKDVCSETETLYQVQGPFKVSRDGMHYVTNLSHLNTPSHTIWDIQFCFAIYSAPPQTDHPELNRLGFQKHYYASFNLEADTDYYLLVQSVDNRLSDYFLVIAPPAPFEINPWMSGLWADPETDGQGLMLNVYPSIDALHLAWFTYDLERPSNAALAQIGEPGHRWLTAFGGLAGADSNMTITRTSGGVFDATQPVPAQIQDGSVQLHFDSCTSGILNYNLGTAQSTGQLILRRPYEDRATIDRCLLENMGPDIPGPL
jgi:hypothetical protein